MAESFFQLLLLRLLIIISVSINVQSVLNLFLHYLICDYTLRVTRSHLQTLYYPSTEPNKILGHTEISTNIYILLVGLYTITIYI